MATDESSTRSPFPGMDPYLERYWDDVHHMLIAYARDQLQPSLPPDLRARAEQRVFVDSSCPADDAEEPESRGRFLRPDIAVAESGHAVVTRTAPSWDLATAEPLVVQLADEPVSQGYIQIIDVRSGGRVVTVIEMISPSNKVPGAGHALYSKKQREVLASGANLVEIDLTRAGDRGSILPWAAIPPSHRTTYTVCVRRATRPLELAVYALPLDHALPAIAIPLRETDSDVRLDLQPLVDLCYRNGRYEDTDYSAALDPPLVPADASWFATLERAQSGQQ